MNRRLVISISIVLVVCVCLTIAGIGVLAAGLVPYTSITARQIASPVVTYQSQLPATTVPVLTTPPPETPLPLVSQSTADSLRSVSIPKRDLYQIVPRLTKNAALLTPLPTPAPRTRQVGDRDSFFVVVDWAAGKYRTANATLQMITPHSYFWVEDGYTVDPASLQEGADYFENSVYPTDHKYFGTEQSPGVDGDVHINILNAKLDPHTAGYFSSEDTYPRQFFQYSNQRNIIYMNVEAGKPNQDEYKGDLAHEFQHMIHSAQAPRATSWIDEGMGDLAIKVNGFNNDWVLPYFTDKPDTQLDGWAIDETSLAHYAASYLFFDYTAGRFGPDFTRNVILAPLEGINGIQSVLNSKYGGLSFDELFADWTVANYLNDPSVENGKYAYTNESIHVSREPRFAQYPITRTATIHEYAANYYALQPVSGDVTVYFTGTTTAKLIAADAKSGKWVWYSNRGDLSDMTLTREVDLTSQNKATLQYSTWYDIEKDFDYAYVEASVDGGRTWDILHGKQMSTDNPNGANYGAGYTGRSGAAAANAPAQWVQDQVDLSSYAGKKVLIRFEYITDDEYNGPSWALDDIAIPEIGFKDDAESPVSGWQAQGFIRSDNVLPQKFIVQVVERGATTKVVRIPLDSQNRGNLTITGFGKDVTSAELIVAAEAPTTTELTQYQFALVPK